MRIARTILLLGALSMWPTAALAAEGNAPPQGSWLVLLFYVINFAIFVYLIVRFAGPAIDGFFHARASQIRSELGRSEAALRDAEQAASTARERLAALEGEKERLRNELQRESEREAARIGELAHAAAQRIRRDGELMAQATAERARRQLRARLGAAAVAAAGDLIRADFETSDQVRLINNFLATVRRGARS